MLRVHLFWDHAEPPEFAVFCPGTESPEPVVIGGYGFRALKQFVAFNKFGKMDADYAQLFTCEHEADLERAYLAVTAGSKVLDRSLNAMLNHMHSDEAYLAFNKKVFSPVAQSFFASLTSSVRERGPEIMKTWVQHRFGHLDREFLPQAVEFVSQDYLNYALALTELFASFHDRMSARKLNARVLTKLLGKQPCVFDLVFRNKNLEQARARRQVPEDAECPFRRLRLLLT